MKSIIKMRLMRCSFWPPVLFHRVFLSLLSPTMLPPPVHSQSSLDSSVREALHLHLGTLFAGHRSTAVRLSGLSVLHTWSWIPVRHCFKKKKFYSQEAKGLAGGCGMWGGASCCHFGCSLTALMLTCKAMGPPLLK